MLRAELSKALAQQPSASLAHLGRGADERLNDADHEAAPSAPAPELLPLYDRASALIEAGIQKARWTAADVEGVRGLIERLDPTMQVELVQKIDGAINSGKMIFESEGRPF